MPYKKYSWLLRSWRSGFWWLTHTQEHTAQREVCVCTPKGRKLWGQSSLPHHSQMYTLNVCDEKELQWFTAKIECLYGGILGECLVLADFRSHVTLYLSNAVLKWLIAMSNVQSDKKLWNYILRILVFPPKFATNDIHGACIVQLSMRGGLKCHVLPTKNGGSVVGSHSTVDLTPYVSQDPFHVIIYSCCCKVT